MVRWEDIHPRERASFEERLAGRYTAPFEETPWVEAPNLADARVAIVTTAALHRSDDRPFTGHVGDYRIIPGDIDYQDLAMTHSSTNFDRSAYQQDVNVCFPLDHLRTLAESGLSGPSRYRRRHPPRAALCIGKARSRRWCSRVKQV